MLRSKKLAALAVVLIGAIVFGSPPLAQAAPTVFAVQAYDDGVLVTGGVQVITTGPGSGSDSMTYAFTPTNSTITHFSISNGGGSSNNPGNSTLAHLALSNNATVSAIGGGTHTLTLILTETNYTAPPGTQLLLASSAGGSYIAPPTDNIVSTYLNFLDPTNTAFGDGTGGTLSPPVAANAHSTPLQSTGTVTGAVLTTPLVFSPGVAMNLVPSAIPFSMSEVLTYTFTSAAGGDVANVSGSSDAIPTPAPAGIVLALTGLPILGLRHWLRRRSKTA